MNIKNTMMKISVFTALFFIGFSVYGDENTAMWTRLYNRLDTIEYKLSIMQNIAEIGRASCRERV